MKTSRLLFAFALASLGLLAARVCGAEGKYVEPRSSDPTAFSVQPDGSLWAEIPVSIVGQEMPGESRRLPVEEVLVRGASSPEVAALTKVTLNPATGARGALVDVRIGVETGRPVLPLALRLPGEFVVRVQIEPWKPLEAKPAVTTANPNPAPEPLTRQFRDFKLTRPAARLEAPASYSATQVLTWGGVVVPEKSKFLPLIVKEAGGLSSITTLTVADVSQRTEYARITDAKLEADAISLPPTESKVLTLRASKPFPLGENEGKIELRATELTAVPAQPAVVPITYKVRTHLETYYIFVLAGCGALVGWIVRGGLKWWEARAGARADAAASLAAVEAALKKFGDEKFQKTLKDLMPSVTAKFWQAPATLAANAKTCNTEVENALGDLKLRSEEVLTGAKALKAALPEAWSFPAPIYTEVKALAGSLTDSGPTTELPAARKGVRTLLAEGRPEEASALIEAGIKVHVPSIVTAAVSWVDEFGAFRAQLVAPNAALPATFKDWVKGLVELSPAVGTPPTAQSTPLVVGSWLENLFTTAEQARYQIARVSAGVGIAFAPVIGTLRSRDKLVPAGDLLEEVAGELLQQVLASFDAPGKALGAFRDSLAEVHKAWAKAVGALAGLPQTDIDELWKLIAAGAYVEAAERMVSFFPPPAALLYPLMGEWAAAGGRKLVLPGFSVPALAFAKSPRPELSVFDLFGMSQLRQTSGGLAAAYTEVMLGTIVQALLACALYSVSIYIAAEPKFIGTNPELIGIFLGAFAWDVSFTTILSKFK